MIDEHLKLPEFGIFPEIFGISSYSIFVALGIAAGLIYYMRDSERRKVKGEGVIEIVSAALIFGVIGSKIPLILEGGTLENILFGKSIVGGLIGGYLGVKFIKRRMNLSLKMGNIIAPAVALGMSFGRIGCFLNGCCYGKTGIFGFDFGDGHIRYPTQLFEVAFHFITFLILHNIRDQVKRPGILFKYYILCYFIFRFFVEFIRVNPVIWFGLTIYQMLSAAVIIVITLGMLRDKFLKNLESSAVKR
ncbi:MAG: prolipoprotein diacylglyceryl transferase [Eubacteriaceae bacterium]|nr:prolipoprotein diacylglyceryl transferase [Eubacteriaceae bacterium]